MPEKKFNSVKEVRDERAKLDEKYENGLPDYLVDYFDEEELRQIKREVIPRTMQFLKRKG